MAQHFSTDSSGDTPGVPAAPAPQEADGKRSRKRRLAAVGAGVLIGLAVLGYGLGFNHYSTHFTPKTTVGGIDASGLSTEALARELEEETSTYTAHVSGAGLDFNITAADIDLKVDGHSIATDAMAETNPAAWPLALLTGNSLDPSGDVTYDAGKLEAKVAAEVAAHNEGAEQPTNATIIYDKKAGAFVASPSKVGTAVDAVAVTTKVGKALSGLSGTVKLGADDLVQPPITANDPNLVAAIDKANKIVGLTVPLTLDGKEVASVGPDLIKDWVSVSGPEEGYAVSVNRDAIERWSFENLNAVVNGETETRVWEVHSWEVARQLAPRLEAADGSALEVPTITIEERPEESEGHEARGRHIDVNLSTQYARLYDADGRTVLWRSPLVSGNLAENHATPTGEYSILSKETDVVLSGLEDGVVLKEGEEPGPEDYYNSYVRYWMCFQGTDLGLHDADWRWQEEFGGDTYTWNGSHGCINLPVDKAEELFNLIKVGDPVYIHS